MSLPVFGQHELRVLGVLVCICVRVCVVCVCVCALTDSFTWASGGLTGRA